MSATGETRETETAHTGAQPGSATGETVILTVDEAAELLGITPQAVRKRIKAGSLPARRDGRAWRVFLERATDETAARDTAKPRPQPETKPVAHPQAHQLAALVEPFTAPLMARIEELSRENGRLQAERDTLQWERDHLAEQVPAERAAWEELARTAAERDALKAEIARLTASDDARSPETGPRDSARLGAHGEASSGPETSGGPPDEQRNRDTPKLPASERKRSWWRTLLGVDW